MTAKLFLTFPQRLIQQPILHDLIRRYPVKTNIRGASITDEIALMALHIDGAPDDVRAAIAWLREIGAIVEELAD
ncbi:MAG: NIL domain-containing protein [Planctomycetes bacterium]|nr:NIL domain-containing protein [Planctomycetota bacterium]